MKIKSLILCLMLACLPFHASKAANEYIETTASIVCSETKIDENNFSCIITYKAEASTAVDQDGKPIKGPIEQQFLTATPKEYKSEVKIKYMQNEPVIYEIIK